MVEILAQFPMHLDVDDVLMRLALPRRHQYSADIARLFAATVPILNVKAVHRVSYVDNRGRDIVDIDGVRFASRVLRVNLEAVERVFPFVLTIGPGLEDLSDASNDVSAQYWLEAIGDMVLGSSTQYLEGHIRAKYRIDRLSRMNPGSLQDWPIAQQKQLFSIIGGDVRDLIGVRLTQSFLMIPRKSVSGISFPTEVTFHSCQLCPRKSCVGRKAPYDKDLAEDYA